MDVKPTQAAMILAFFLSFFLAIFYCYDQQLKYHGVSALEVHDQQLYALLGHQLFRYDKNGFVDKTDLQALGIKDVIGGISFYPNGDLLIRAQTQSLSLSDSLKVFARQSADSTHTFEDARLLRCQLAEKTCQFAAINKPFTRVFQSHILANEEVLITDTSAHELLWFDQQGREKSFIDSDLAFPNGFVVNNNMLLLANTNRHVIEKIALSEEGFATQENWQSLALDFSTLKQSGHQFPLRIETLNHQLLLLVADANLAAGRLILITEDGDFVREFTAPEQEDFVALAVFNGHVIVSDFFMNKLYHFSDDGEFLGDFKAPELQAALADNQQQMKALQGLMYALIAIVVVVFMVIFIYAIKQELRQEARLQQHRRASAASVQCIDKPHIDDDGIHWLEKDEKIKKTIKYLPLLLLALFVMSLLSLLPLLDQSDEPVTLLKGIAIPFAFIAIIMLSLIPLLKHQLHSRIGVKGQWIILEDAKANVAIEEASLTKKSPTAIIIDHVHVNLPNHPHHNVYKKQQIDKYLQPLLAQAIKVSEFSFYQYLWHKRDPLVIIVIPMILLAALLMIYLEYFS